MFHYNLGWSISVSPGGWPSPWESSCSTAGVQRQVLGPRGSSSSRGHRGGQATAEDTRSRETAGQCAHGDGRHPLCRAVSAVPRGPALALVTRPFRGGLPDSWDQAEPLSALSMSQDPWTLARGMSTVVAVEHSVYGQHHSIIYFAS